MNILAWVVAIALFVGVAWVLVLAVRALTTGRLPRGPARKGLSPRMWAVGIMLQCVALVWLGLTNIRHGLVGPLALWWLGPALLYAGIVVAYWPTFARWPRDFINAFRTDPPQPPSDPHV
jgi:hypothetical protein